MEATLYKATGEEQKLDLPKEDNLSTLQKYVGGWIQVVPAVNMTGYLLVVNEEGLLMNLKPNILASLLAGQSIVGDAILMKSEFLQ